MDISLIYTIAYASTLGFLLAWRLSQSIAVRVRERVFSYIFKWTVYTVLLPRAKGSSDVTIVAAFVIVTFGVLNVAGCLLAVKTQADLSLRLARLCGTNIVFLYLGGRCNLLLDKIFQLSHQEHNLLHRWIGRIALMEGLIHGTIELINSSKAPPKPIDLSLMAVSGTIAVLSLVYVRRKIYEFFLRTHLLGSLALLVLVWLHIPRHSRTVVICVFTASGLLILQKGMWLLLFLHRNSGSGPASRVIMSRYTQTGIGGEVLQLRVDVRRPWTVRPGQYVYLSLPALRSVGLGILEAHPFMIAWALDDERGCLKTIILLIQSRRGFTRRLQLANTIDRALLDGPYGGTETELLESYDKVLLLSSGIGIAAHLYTARFLLLAHNQQTARVRRLTLAWLLESQDQMQWAEEFLKALDDIDHRQILTVFIFYPSETEEFSKNQAEDGTRRRILPMCDKLDMGWFIEQEWGAEAGNMLVSACGSARFELCARRAIKSSLHDIDFRNCEFQPCETEASRLSGLRYSS